MPPFSFITGGQGMTAGEEADPRLAQVEELLSRLGITGSQLEFPAPPQPPQTSRSSQILGPLGDAIRAMAAVRGGGQAPPIGAFAAGQREQQTEFERRQFENEQANRTLRNQIRIGLLRPQQTRFQPTSGFLPRTQLFRDEAGNTFMSSTQIGTEGVGETTLKNLDPRGDPNPVGTLVPLNPAPRTETTTRGVEIFDPRRGTLAPTGQFPPPPPGIVTDVAAATATLGSLDELRSAYKEIRAKTAGEGGVLERGKQVIGTFAGETRLGGILAPEYAKYTAKRRASLNAYIKSVTGAQFSIKELTRYEGQYPEPWDPEDLAETKIQSLAQRALTDMEAKIRAFPGAAGAAPQAAPVTPNVDDLLRQYEEEFGATTTP